MRPLSPSPSAEALAIGARIRSARKAQGFTLEQIATSAGLTKGFLSRLERDETSPSVATLVQLCQVLSLEIGSLFAEPEAVKISLADAPHINLGGQGVDERLISPRNESRVQVIRTHMQPGANGGDAFYTISCEVEVLHVISGAVTARFVDREIPLAAGDSLTFPGREPHNWEADAELGAEVIWTIVPATWRGE
ncbi:XRE family transcriptional regulator [Salinibacterium amurskyense]|uniref:XRE family transcriptional regulator n=1 Tax=Salinibacterium amurskyense TaxID=205941 RepID=A0A2M9D2X9_9MICO|nr:helix-turn-helix domain-containing protein [Salinibacterium amurskyense]PJJ78413.1 XRE family transcriptional regulator [Salinibacterium amurskyense]RLQ80513.1 helix-turn-helix domain-containing protein [Salinibacterium amurskyense]GHD83285.1 transcription regulator [Salinibacterium amurskyense]